MANRTNAYRGRDAALFVGDGGTPEEFVKIAGLQTNNVQINNNAVDITNMGSEGEQEWLPDGGVKAMQISASGFVVTDDAGAFERFERLAETRQFIPIQYERANGIAYEGSFVATDYSYDNSHDGAQQFSITLQSSGPITIERPS